MTKTFTANIEITIRQLTAHEDYDGNLIEEEFQKMCNLESALHFAEYFGFMPLIKIDKIYMADCLYEGLVESKRNAVNSLLRDYFDSVIEVIGGELYEASIKHVNTKFDFWFCTQMPGVDAVTFMPQKKSADQGACLYFGPAVSSELLTQLVDGMSDEVVVTCETSNECAGA
nr:hypothetical protein [Rhodoferax sp.]